jgi:transcription elongation factor GreB
MDAPPNYISREGAEKLRVELDHLLTVERPRVVETVAAAAAEGDRSENAEYIYGKKRLREIDRRIGFLNKRLDSAHVVDRPSTTDKVVFLSWVEVEDDDGETQVLRLVGADETDPKSGWISWKSPVGHALLGRREGDVVRVQTPGGEVEYTIAGIFDRDPR